MTLRPTDGLTLAKDERARVSLTPYQQITNPDGTVAQREVHGEIGEVRARRFLLQHVLQLHAFFVRELLALDPFARAF